MKRFMYAACSETEPKFLNNPAVITASYARYEDMILLYFETTGEEIKPEAVAQLDTSKTFGSETWFRMAEIFHYFEPENDEQWVRKAENKTSTILVNKLHYEKVAGYIFYHFMYQNEYPTGQNKYMSIWNLGNYIFIYSEAPTEPISPEETAGKYEKKPKHLITWDDFAALTEFQKPDWGKLMNEHFKPWEDGEQKWVPLTTNKNS